MEYTPFTHDDIMKMPADRRRAFFPKLSGIKNAVIIGTQNQQGLSNAALFNSLTHIGSHPPLLGVVFRPLTVERHSYQNIKDTGYFSINWILTKDLDPAHQCSAKYDRHVSEFETVGRPSESSSQLPLPYWPGAPVRLGLKYEEEHLIQANQTILLIGSVQEIELNRSLLDDEGIPDFSKSSTLLVNGLETYFKAQPLRSKPYARP